MMTGFRIPVSPDPHLRRWMLFVDGENLTIRAQELARRGSLRLEEGKYHLQNVFIWPSVMSGIDLYGNPEALRLQERAIRGYYYTSVQGDEDKISEVRQALWRLSFTPQVFKRTAGKRSKRVDIMLTLDMLHHAVSDHYDAAVLVAGDEDYVPLVEQVKRLGKVVLGSFFTAPGLGLSQALQFACDGFIEIEGVFLEAWRTDAQK